MAFVKIYTWQLLKNVWDCSFPAQATTVGAVFLINCYRKCAIPSMFSHVTTCPGDKSSFNFFIDLPEVSSGMGLDMGTHGTNPRSCSSPQRCLCRELWRFKCQQSYFTSDRFRQSMQLMCLSSRVGYSIHPKGHSRGIRLRVLNRGWFHAAGSRLGFPDGLVDSLEPQVQVLAASPAWGHMWHSSGPPSVALLKSHTLRGNGQFYPLPYFPRLWNCPCSCWNSERRRETVGCSGWWNRHSEPPSLLPKSAQYWQKTEVLLQKLLSLGLGRGMWEFRCYLSSASASRWLLSCTWLFGEVLIIEIVFGGQTDREGSGRPHWGLLGFKGGL